MRVRRAAEASGATRAQRKSSEPTRYFQVCTAPSRRSLSAPAVVCGATLAAVPLFSFDAEAGLNWVPQLMSMLLAAAIAMTALREGRFSSTPTGVLLFAAWCAWAGVTLLINPPPAESWTSYFTVLKVAGLTVLASMAIRSRHDLQFVIGCFVASSAPIIIGDSALFGDYLSLGGMAFRTDMLGRYSGRLANANLMALYMLMVAWASVTSCAISSGRHRWLWLAPVVPALYITLFTGSRKGLLGIPITAYFTYLCLRSKTSGRPRWLAFVAAGILAAVAGWTVLDSGYAGRLTQLFEPVMESSASTRGLMVSAGVEMWLEHPFTGAGFDQFRLASWEYGLPSETYSHSTVVETLAGTGLIGFALYFGAVTLLIADAFRYMRAARHRDAALALSSLWLMTLFLMFSLFAVAYDNRFAWPLIGVISASLASAIRPSHSQRHSTQRMLGQFRAAS